MPSFLPARAVALRDWLIAASFLPVGVLIAANVHCEAVANKLVDRLGAKGVNWGIDSMIKTVLAPAQGAGEAKIKNIMLAIVALVLLGALVFFLFGVFRTLGGRRGGIEAVGQVLFAIILAIAGLEILE